MKQDSLSSGVHQESSSMTCGKDWLGQRLLKDHGKGILLLDCRSHTDYHISHVHGAIHVTIPSLMLRRLQNGNLPISSVLKTNESKERFNSQCKTDILVLYDDKEDSDRLSPSPSANVVGLLAKKLQNDGCRVKTLVGKLWAHWILKSVALGKRKSHYILNHLSVFWIGSVLIGDHSSAFSHCAEALWLITETQILSNGTIRYCTYNRTWSFHCSPALYVHVAIVYSRWVRMWSGACYCGCLVISLNEFFFVVLPLESVDVARTLEIKVFFFLIIGPLSVINLFGSRRSLEFRLANQPRSSADSGSDLHVLALSPCATHLCVSAVEAVTCTIKGLGWSVLWGWPLDKLLTWKKGCFLLSEFANYLLCPTVVRWGIMVTVGSRGRHGINTILISCMGCFSSLEWRWKSGRVLHSFCILAHRKSPITPWVSSTWTSITTPYLCEILVFYLLLLEEISHPVFTSLLHWPTYASFELWPCLSHPGEMRRCFLKRL